MILRRRISVDGFGVVVSEVFGEFRATLYLGPARTPKFTKFGSILDRSISSNRVQGL